MAWSKKIQTIKQTTILCLARWTCRTMNYLCQLKVLKSNRKQYVNLKPSDLKSTAHPENCPHNLEAGQVSFNP